jgi:hypothetical protein
VSAHFGPFALPSARFQHVNIEMVVMPPSEGHRYCLTMINRFSLWPEAVALHDQEASNVALAFFETWISRFGVPLRITTDQGRQFVSFLFRHLNVLTGTTHPHHGVPPSSQRDGGRPISAADGSYLLPRTTLDGDHPARPLGDPIRLEGCPGRHIFRNGVHPTRGPSW